jgi:hypothetical protein
MNPSARAQSRAALLLLCAAATLTGCSLWPGHGDDPTTSPAQSQAQSGGGQSNLGGQSGTASAGAPTASASKPKAIRRGQRGTGCTVANDCAAGLSCVRGQCEPANFGLTASGKECVQIDCTTSADCCGKLSTEIPDACRSRASACLETLPGCETKACTRSSDCAGGGVCSGHCLISSGECSGNIDCLANKCISGSCSINFTACSTDADCAANTCSGGNCNCANPSYTPTKPVCSDPACDGLCLWACEDSRCVIPTVCSTDDDCFGSKPHCEQGECVECTDSTDCSFDRICRKNSCETRCQNDANCALFEACQAGECIYVGCRSDRECSLIPDVNALELPPGLDPRALRCHTENRVGTCVIPCENDSQCAVTETCEGGLCKYIGCENDSECKAIVGAQDKPTSDTEPWTPSYDCRAAGGAAN